MYSTAIDYLPALPEIFLLTAVCVVLVIDLFVPDEKRDVTFVATQLTLLITLVMVIAVHQDDLLGLEITTLHRRVVQDPVAGDRRSKVVPGGDLPIPHASRVGEVVRA